MISARIPFAGFYHSIWDREIDHWIEREADEGERSFDELYLAFDTGAVRQEIARRYAAAFGQWLGETLEREVKIEFEELSSPRFYNFETDRIFAKIDTGTLEAIRGDVGREALKEAFKEAFTSRSGFISFYEPVVPDKPVTEWDHNQLYVLLGAWISQEGVDDIDWELFDSDLGERIGEICNKHLQPEIA